MRKSKNMIININGILPIGVTAKDMALNIISKLGTAGGTGFAIEYSGEAVRKLSVEGRMTLCNLTIEAGARTGLVAPDEKTFEYLKGKPFSPNSQEWDKAVSYWSELNSDQGACFDKEINLSALEIEPTVTWGTSPEDSVAIDGRVPHPKDYHDRNKSLAVESALDYMGLKSGTLIKDIKVDRVFIGSCTNGRIEDIREVAKVVDGKKVASWVNAMVVPGSGLVKSQAEEEGLDAILQSAGFEWREPGCSMCNAINPDKLEPGQRCASTSNRNFRGRQGRGGRTHLLSPGMAAAAAVRGTLCDVRELI